MRGANGARAGVASETCKNAVWLVHRARNGRWATAQSRATGHPDCFAYLLFVQAALGFKWLLRRETRLGPEHVVLDNARIRTRLRHDCGGECARGATSGVHRPSVSGLSTGVHRVCLPRFSSEFFSTSSCWPPPTKEAHELYPVRGFWPLRRSSRGLRSIVVEFAAGAIRGSL